MSLQCVEHAFGLAAYGVLVGSVAARSREIGVRLALGAASSDIIGLVGREVVHMTVAGAGVVAVLIAFPLLRAHLYGISPTDPRVIAGVAVAMAATVAAAN